MTARFLVQRQADKHEQTYHQSQKPATSQIEADQQMVTSGDD
jgi:hypothetical protein